MAKRPSGNKYLNIEGSDSTHVRRARRILKDKLVLFEQALRVQHMAFALLLFHGTNLPDHWFVVTSLLSRAFSHQRAICSLLLRGYYPEAMILQRGAYESIDLALYCSTSPERAWDWLQGNKITHKQIRNANEIFLPGEMYSWFSNHVHSRSQGVVPFLDLSISSPNDGSITVHLQGGWEKNKLLEGFELLLGTAAYAVMSMTRAYREILYIYEDWQLNALSVTKSILPIEFSQALKEMEKS